MLCCIWPKDGRPQAQCELHKCAQSRPYVREKTDKSIDFFPAACECTNA